MVEHSGYIFSATCIIIYAWDRFNTPALWRSTTTSTQYRLAQFGYVIAALALAFVITRVIETNPEIASLLASMGGQAQLDPAIPAPFVAALFLTVLLPRIPLLKRVDVAIQRFFREVGAIPRNARRLSAALREAAFAVPPDMSEQVKESLRKQGLDPQDFVAARSDTLEAKWLRTVALYCRLQEEAEAVVDEHPDESGDVVVKATSPFVRDREAEYVSIRASYQRQAALASVVLRPKQVTDDSGRRVRILSYQDGTDENMVPLVAALQDDNRKLFRDMAYLISCGVLRSKHTLAAANKTLRQWGFAGLDVRKPGLTVNEVAGIFVMIAGYMLLFFAVSRYGQGGGRKLIVPLSIAVTMVASVVCAIYPKMRFGFATRDHDGGRPYLVYVISGMLAVGCWGGVHYLRIMLQTGNPADLVLAEIWLLAPVSLVSFMTAFATAWLADNTPGEWRIPPYAVRWAEALALGVVLALTMSVAIDLYRSHAGRMPPSPDHIIVLSVFGAGCLIGFFVPTMYRREHGRVSPGRVGNDRVLPA